MGSIVIPALLWVISKFNDLIMNLGFFADNNLGQLDAPKVDNMLKCVILVIRG